MPVVSDHTEFGGSETIRDRRQYAAKAKELAVAYRTYTNDNDQHEVVEVSTVWVWNESLQLNRSCQTRPKLWLSRPCRIAQRRRGHNLRQALCAFVFSSTSTKTKRQSGGLIFTLSCPRHPHLGLAHRSTSDTRRSGTDHLRWSSQRLWQNLVLKIKFLTR